MSYTDEQYRQLGTQISAEQWKSRDWHKENLSIVSSLARLIYAEAKDDAGQASVAQELLNRMRYWRFFDGRHMKFVQSERYNWYGVIFAANQYSPIQEPNTNLLIGPLAPAWEWDTKSANDKSKWTRAVDYATMLSNERIIHQKQPFPSALITNQMYHQGGFSDQGNQIVQEIFENGVDLLYDPDGDGHGTFHSYWDMPYKGGYKLCWDAVYIAGNVFYNDDNSVDNIINEYDVPLEVPNAGDNPNNTNIPVQSASMFIDFLKSRVGCGYVLGTYGQICTQQLLEKRSSADPENGSSYYLGECSRWIGKLVTDCSGLIEWFLLKQGVSNCDSYSGGMYRNWCSTKSTDMTRMPTYPGIAVFKRNSKGVYHIGIYVGKDRVIEAKGAAYGVVVSKFSADQSWNAWGYFDWLAYDLEESDVTQLPIVTDALTYGPLPGYPDIRTSADEVVQHSGSYSSPVYRKGDSGDKIEMIRRRFWAEDSSFIVNNFFDDVLEAKVKVFQTANSLTADGLVGSGTWKRLFPVLKKRTGSQAGAPAMQALLNYQNYPVGTPDGLFGTGTETVLKAYQAARQLDADGVCGEKTWQSLTLDEPFENEVLIDQNGDSTTLCEMGDSNTTVKQLQKRLSLNYHLAVSGTYDSATDACVRAYQQANGITANGNVGPITWKKLFPILKMGRGTKDEVRALQMLLCYQKHSVLIDGIFGSGTMAAVKAYQTLRNLTSDGIVGENTWASLCIATPPDGAGQYFGTGGGSTGGNGNTIYRQGDTGAAVHQIKRRMAVENLFSGTVDSTFDVQLTYDVKRYQAAEGTRIDGLVGPATWSLLFPVVKKQVGQQSGAKAVQALLNLNGYNVGTPDGLFGTGSENKLKQFQTANGLTSDGVCGANTWAKLCEV